MCSASQQVHDYIVSEEGCAIEKSSILSVDHVVGVITCRLLCMRTGTAWYTASCVLYGWRNFVLPYPSAIGVVMVAGQLGAPGHGVAAVEWCRSNRVQNSTKVAISIWWYWVELVAGPSTFDSSLFSSSFLFAFFMDKTLHNATAMHSFRNATRVEFMPGRDP